MTNTRYHGLDPTGNWNVDTPDGMARSKEWMERHLSFLTDRATWAVPRSGSIIEFDKPSKTARLTHSFAPGIEESTAKVLKAMGWTWIDDTEENS